MKRPTKLSTTIGFDESAVACEVTDADAADDDDDEEVDVICTAVSEEVNTEFVPVASNGFPDNTVVLAGTKEPCEFEVETGSYEP